MHNDHDCPSDAFDVIADLEARVATLEYGDSYALYDVLHEAAGRLGPVGCFYVCLYAAETERLHFAYNRDGDYLEEPATMPLGEGPTSWVIRNGRPLILSDATAAIQQRGILFGDVSRRSASAVHLPMRTVGHDGRRCLIGVLSAQSYEPNAYSPQAVLALQGLADRAARLLHQDNSHDDCRRRISAAEQDVDRLRARIARLSDEFVAMTSDLSRKAHEIHESAPKTMPEVREAALKMYRACHRFGSVAAQAPLGLDMVHEEPPAAPAPLPAAGLTEREMEIAGLLATGKSNADIAEALFISVDTVKFHCSNLYRKLNVQNRVQAVRAAAALISDRPA